MKNLSKIVIAAASLIATAALGTTAYAHMEGRGHGGFHGGGGYQQGGMDGGWKRHGRRHGGADMRRQMEEMLNTYDTDKDGKITEAEVVGVRQNWVKEFDENKDGQLSLDEFRKLWTKRREERIVRAFQHFDRDGNAQVTAEEYDRPAAKMTEHLNRMQERMEHRGKRDDRMMQDDTQQDDMQQDDTQQEGMPQDDAPADEAPAEGGTAN